MSDALSPAGMLAGMRTKLMAASKGVLVLDASHSSQNSTVYAAQQAPTLAERIKSVVKDFVHVRQPSVPTPGMQRPDNSAAA